MSQEFKRKSVFFMPKINFKKLFKNLFVWLIKSFFALMLILVFFFISYQITFVRKIYNSFIIDVVNEQLLGKVSFADLYIKSYDKIEIRKLKLFVDGDTAISFDKLVVEFSLRNIFKDTIVVDNIYLDNPTIKVLRNTFDKDWNVNKIAKPSQSLEEENKPPKDFFIRVNNLNLNNGSFYLIDSNSVHRTDGIIDYSNMQFGEMVIKISALLNLNGPTISSNIKFLSLKELVTDTFIEELKAFAKLNPKGAILDSLKIKAPNHYMEANIRVDSMNVFTGIGDKEIRNFLYTVDLNGEKINPNFVKKFATIPLNLGEFYTINAKIKGTLEALTIDFLNYQTRNTDLKLKGQLTKILDVDKANYKISIFNSVVNDIDLTRILKDIKLSTIPEFGNTVVDCYVDGSYDSAYTEFKINSTKVGQVEGYAGLRFSSPNWYFAKLNMQNMNLSSIVRNSNITSQLSGSLDIDGKELIPQKMNNRIKLKVHNGSILSYPFAGLNLVTHMKDGLLNIDTLLIKQSGNIDSNINRSSKFIFARGIIDISSFDNIKYKLDLDVNRFNISEFLKNNSLPQNINANFELIGENTNIDKLNLVLKSDISELDFSDRSLLPFDFSLSMKENFGQNSIELNSKFIQAQLDGNFKLSKLLPNLNSHFENIFAFVDKRMKSLLPNDSNINRVVHKIPFYEPSSFSLKSKINDLSILSPFLENTKLICKADIDVNVEISKENSKLELSKLSVIDFLFKNENFNLKLIPDNFPLVVNGIIELPIIDSLPSIQKFNLFLFGNNTIELNNLLIKYPKFKIEFNEDYANFQLFSNLSNLIDFRANGHLNFNSDNLKIIFDSSKIVYDKSLIWKNSEPIDISLSNNGIEINKFILLRDNNENIKISGIFTNNNKNNININISNLDLTGMNEFLNNEQKSILKTLNGNIKELDINFYGDLSNPQIDLNLLFNKLSYNNVKIKDAKSRLRYYNSVASGDVDIKINDNSKFLINLQKIPINLSNFDSLFSQKESIKANALLSNIPINLFSNFIPAVKNINGNIDGAFDIYGYLPNQIKYKGFLNLDTTSLTLEPTNMDYLANGKITVDNDIIKIDSLSLINSTNDLIDGEAKIFGTVKLDNFNPKFIDIKFKSPQIKLLNNNSYKSMPDLYGDFIISTGDNPIRFYGTLEEPNLEGDVNVLNAKLLMPPSNSISKITTKANYIKTSEGFKFTELKMDTVNTAIKPKEENFADLINYDLWIKIPGRFTVNMDLGTLGKLFTDIETENKNSPLHYTYNRISKERKLTGKLILNDRSNLNFLTKSFSTTGNISMPNGSLDNPHIDLTADYQGSTNFNNSKKTYLVKLYIKGTKEKPNIKFDYWIDGEQAKGDSSAIARDAMFLILLGRTSAQLIDSSAAGFNPAADLGTSGLSQLFSQTATQLLQGTGFIQSADIDLAGGSWDKARLKLSGQLYGNIIWKVGGTMSDFSNSNEFSIDIPLPYVLHPDLLNNIIIQLTKQTNNINNVSAYQKEWEVKFQFGGNW